MAIDESDIASLSRRVVDLRYLLESNRQHVALIDDVLVALDEIPALQERTAEAEGEQESAKISKIAAQNELEVAEERIGELEKHIKKLEETLANERVTQHGYYTVVSELGELLGAK